MREQIRDCGSVPKLIAPKMWDMNHEGIRDDLQEVRVQWMCHQCRVHCLAVLDLLVLAGLGDAIGALLFLSDLQLKLIVLDELEGGVGSGPQGLQCGPELFGAERHHDVIFPQFFEGHVRPFLHPV